MMSGPVVQGIDTLTSAMTSNIIPDREYLLQGSILDNHVEVLTHRLRGLCNNVGAGRDEQFSEREMVFSIRVASGGPNTTAQPVTTLRVRKSEQPGMEEYYGVKYRENTRNIALWPY